jgi:hypothetical protein
MAAKVKVIQYRDRGLKDAIKRLTAGHNIAARVGVLDPTASAPHPLRQNITIGEVAILNEYGSRKARVPRRSFLRETMKRLRVTSGSGAVMSFLNGAIGSIVEGNLTARQALMQLGAMVDKEVRATIYSHVPPPNHPVTIKNKGHDETLIHTGTLVNAISHDVTQHIAYGDSATLFKPEVLESEYASVETEGGEGPYEGVSVTEGGE